MFLFEVTMEFLIEELLDQASLFFNAGCFLFRWSLCSTLLSIIGQSYVKTWLHLRYLQNMKFRQIYQRRK